MTDKTAFEKFCCHLAQQSYKIGRAHGNGCITCTCITHFCFALHLQVLCLFADYTSWSLIELYKATINHQPSTGLQSLTLDAKKNSRLATSMGLLVIAIYHKCWDGRLPTARTYSINHVYLHTSNAFDFWQMRLELLWIGLRIWNAFSMNRKFTFCLCLILICDLWAFGGLSFIQN